MAINYATGTAADQDALMTALKDFAVTTNSWTQDAFSTSTDLLEIHKGTCYVQFLWDSQTSPDGGIAFFQSTGYDGSGPGSEPGDSGNGDDATPYTAERRLNNIGNGPFTYFFFADTTPDYIHGVVEFATGIYRHFSFGTIEKAGSWTGGEYCTAASWDTAAKSSLTDFRHYWLFDMLHTSDPYEAATIHIEGMPNEGGSSKWGVAWTGSEATTGLDGDGNARVRIQGHFRDGYLMNAVGWLRANPNNGFVPMFPIHLYYWDDNPAPDQIMFLGTVPDMRGINIHYLEPEEEFTIGSETWKIFPWTQKSSTGTAEESGNMGVAYRKA